jgi:hypothetical protein
MSGSGDGQRHHCPFAFLRILNFYENLDCLREFPPR